MAGSTNPADIFTKEDNDVKHFETLRDQMVSSQEEFAQSSTSTKTLNNNIQTIDSNPDILWGVLERELEDQDSEERSQRNSHSRPRSQRDSRDSRPRSDSEELTPRIISKKLTPLIKSKSLTQHKYKDPNLGQNDGLGLSRSKIEVACE